MRKRKAVVEHCTKKNYRAFIVFLCPVRVCEIVLGLRATPGTAAEGAAAEGQGAAAEHLSTSSVAVGAAALGADDSSTSAGFSHRAGTGSGCAASSALSIETSMPNEQINVVVVKQKKKEHVNLASCMYHANF
jgi:hypothetical protein